MDINKDLFMCPICTDEYKDPRLLRCGHSFCLSCLQQWANQQQNDNKRVVCPTCKEITRLKMNSNGVQQLPKDFKVNQIKDVFTGVSVSLKQRSFGKVMKCQFCSVEDSSRFCVICDKTLCVECEKRHKKNTLFRDHCTEVIQPNMETYLLCDIHNGDTVRYFCSTCNKPMCPICAMDPKHEAHQKTSMAEGLEQCSQSLKSLLEPLKIQYKANAIVLQDTESAKAEMNTEFIRSKELLERVTDEMVAQVQEWEMSMNKELQQQHDMNYQITNSYIQNVTQDQKEIEELQTSISSLGNGQNSLTHMVSHSDEVMSKCKELTSKPAKPLQLKVQNFKYPVHPPNLTEHLKSILGTKEKLLSVNNYEDVEIVHSPPESKLLWAINKRSSQTGEILSPISVSISSHDEIIVSEIDSHRVQIFDKFGNTVQTISHIAAKGAVADNDNNIYIVDSNSCEVVIFNCDGREIARWGKDVFFSPRCIALTPQNDNIVVVDKQALKITVHERDGTVVYTSGDQVRLKCPVAVCVNSKGCIIVADRELNDINVFTKTCQYVFTIPVVAQSAPVTQVTGVSIDQEDNIYVCLHENKKIIKYSPTGDFIKVVLSVKDNIKWLADVAFGMNGYLAVVESKVTAKHSALKLFKIKC